MFPFERAKTEFGGACIEGGRGIPCVGPSAGKRPALRRCAAAFGAGSPGWPRGHPRLLSGDSRLQNVMVHPTSSKRFTKYEAG